MWSKHVFLSKYLEYNRRKKHLPDRSKDYIKDLGNDIKENCLRNPAILAISKKQKKRKYMREPIVWKHPW